MEPTLKPGILTALNIAVTDHNLVMLVLEYGAKTEAKDSRADTVFHLVAMLGQDTTMRSLMQLQVKPAVGIHSVNHEMKTPLHHVVASGYESMVRLLFEHGVKIEARTFDRNTALHLASSGNEKVAQTLIEFGADSEARNLQKMTALHKAAMSDMDTMIPRCSKKEPTSRLATSFR